MRVPILASLAAAVSLATTAQAAQIHSYKVATWDVGVYTNDQSGRFTHCAAAARYQSGITLLFSVSGNLEWAIGFSSPEWNLREGRNFDVEFRIDNGRVNNASGRAVTDRLVRATLPDSAELFNQFRYGYRMVVSINDNPQVVFNLSNTNAMLTDVLNCARKYKGHVERAGNRPREDDRDARPNDNRDNRPNDNRQPNPREEERDTGRRGDNRTPPPATTTQTRRNDGVGSSGSFRGDENDNRASRTPQQNRDRERDQDITRLERGPVAPPSTTQALGPTPDSRAEATQVATEILRRANFTFEFQKPEQLSATLRDRYDVVWRSEEFTGTLRILPDTRAETIERVRAGVVSADTAACKGKLESGTLPAMADSKSVTMFTTCKGSETSSNYYLIFPRRKGGIYMLGISGSGEVATRLQSVAYAYRTVALEVLEK